jgi:signal transduction histidine kinase
LTTEEKITALVTAIGHLRAGIETELPHWEDDALLAPLTAELRGLLADAQDSRQQVVLEQRRFYEGILDQLPADYALLDENSRYVFMSEHAVRDPELRAWLIGRTDLDFCQYRNIEESLAHQRMAAHQKAFATGEPSQLLEVRPDRTGQMVHKLRLFIPIVDLQGNRLLAAYSHDISVLAAQEQALIAKNAALEKVNYELDQFVYRASHDLRAPLASVQGLLEIALTAASVEESQPYLVLMQRAIVKMDSFIRDIVDHSKNARQELHFEEMSLEGAYQDTLEQLRFMAGADRVAVTLALTADAPLYSDRFRIGILLNNLISNGIKYNNPKQPAPFVQVQAHITATGVDLVVRDNGIGIGAEHLTKVFEMFYRATHLATGTGIGLYIVQEVARKLGGGAELTSELGVGTAFRVWFPNGMA